MFYCDILDFHRRAYKFLRASCWKRFFDSSWGRFDIRFKGVLGSLRYHADLVDKEANSYNIASVQEWREAHLEDVRKREKDRLDDHFEKVLNWFDVKEYIQEDDLDRLVDRCYGGTSDWLLEHAKTKAWIRPGGQHAVLWLNGKPGSGMS